MSTLICGSIAFDSIMVFHDRFRNHILPEQLHILNVSFFVPEMRREFGGCAGNIAYTLKLLGGEPLVMATVGSDFGPYAYRMDRLGLKRDHVRELAEHFTGQAFITTDLDDNQITAFHPGAMAFSHENCVAEVSVPVALGIVAPDGKQGMLEHCEQLAEAGIPFIFDPGQQLPMFSGDELLEFLDLATYACLNDYETKLLSDRTGHSLEALAARVEALIVTLGAEGSRIHAKGEVIEIPCVEADAVVDPTGCGDAYRAGLLYGIKHQLDWTTTGRLASLLGAIKVASRGGQNHYLDWPMLRTRFEQAFGHAWPCTEGA